MKIKNNLLHKTIFARFAGLGDALFVNTIVYHFWRETKKQVWVASNHPEIIKGNPGARTLPFSSPKWLIRAGIVMQKVGLVKGFTFLTYQPDPQEGKMQPLGEHIFSRLAKKAGLHTVPNRPVLFLSPKELNSNRLPLGEKPWVAVHSTGTTEWTDNKNWYPERFEKVSTRLRSSFRVAQLGPRSDPPLSCDLDLRGRLTPREAAATLASAHALICQVGYLMHAAAAVGTPSVVIYGGFEAPWESGYPWNENLFTQLPCSPCWLTGPCPYDKKCMQKIHEDEVIGRVKKILAESRKKIGAAYFNTMLNNAP